MSLQNNQQNREGYSNKILNEIISDFTDRRGLRQEWEQIDSDIQEEIKQTWLSIISKHIESTSQSAAKEAKEQCKANCDAAYNMGYAKGISTSMNVEAVKQEAREEVVKMIEQNKLYNPDQIEFRKAYNRALDDLIQQLTTN